MLHELPRVGRKLLDAADADGKLAYRPRIRQRHRCNCHGPRYTPCGGLRHNANAHIALDQATYRIEAAQLHAQPQRLAGGSGFAGKETLERARAVEPYEIVTQHFGKRNV